MNAGISTDSGTTSGQLPTNDGVPAVKVGDTVTDFSGFAGVVIHIHGKSAWVHWMEAWDDVVELDGLTRVGAASETP